MTHGHYSDILLLTAHPLSTPEAYAYNSDLLQLDEQRPHTPSPLIHGILSRIKTPLQWQEWDKSLLHHPDQQFRSYIVNGIHYGFQVGFNYSQTCQRSKNNLPSCREQPQVINNYLAVECAEGRVLGLLEPNNLPHQSYWCHTKEYPREMVTNYRHVFP